MSDASPRRAAKPGERVMTIVVRRGEDYNGRPVWNVQSEHGATSGFSIAEAVELLVRHSGVEQ